MTLKCIVRVNTCASMCEDKPCLGLNSSKKIWSSWWLWVELDFIAVEQKCLLLRPVDYQRFRDAAVGLSAHTQEGWSKVSATSFLHAEPWLSHDSFLQCTVPLLLQPALAHLLPPRCWCLWCCSRLYTLRVSHWRRCWSSGCVSWRRMKPTSSCNKGAGWVNQWLMTNANNAFCTLSTHLDIVWRIAWFP